MIDVKELHIGSHVRIGGKMHRVCAIDGLNEQIGIEAYKTDTDGVKHPFGYKIGDITPIPLTAELLTEIGFIKRTRYDNDKDYYIDAESARQMERTRLVIPQIEIQNYSEIGNPELWEMKIISTDNYFAVEHKITVRYLYELENFVYMTLHKELIEE